MKVHRLLSGKYRVTLGKKVIDYDSVTTVLSPMASEKVEYGNTKIAYKGLCVLHRMVKDGNLPPSYREFLGDDKHTWLHVLKFIFSPLGEKWIDGTVWIESRKAAQRGTLVHRLKDELSLGNISPDAGSATIAEWLIHEIETWNAAADIGRKAYEEWKSQNPDSKLKKLEWMDQHEYSDERCYADIVDVLPYCISLCAWWSKYRPQAHYIERVLLDKRKRVAGTCDGLMVVDGEIWLYDVKTSTSDSARPSYAAQLGGYWSMTHYYDKDEDEIKELVWPEGTELVVLQVTPGKVMRRYANPAAAKGKWLAALRLSRPTELWKRNGRNDLSERHQPKEAA